MLFPVLYHITVKINPNTDQIAKDFIIKSVMKCE